MPTSLLKQPAEIRPNTHPVKSRPWWVRYGIAVIAIAIATGIRFFVFEVFGEKLALTPYYPAVVAAALWGGPAAGLLATALSLIAGSMFMQPKSFDQRSTWIFNYSFALFVNLVNVWVIYRMQLAFARAEEANESRRRADEALSDSERRFRLMADGAPVLIWIADQSKKCVWFNQPWLDFVGRSMDKEVGDGWTENVHPDDLPGLLKVYHTAVDQRQALSTSYKLRRHDGTYRWVLDHGIPLQHEGRFSGYIGSCVDITEMKLAEQQRQELLDSERLARADAERSSRLKEEFLTTLSHELRTPLNAIFGWCQLLRAGTSDPQELDEGLEVIERNVRMQTKIISDLLDMSRIVSGKIRLDVARVNLSSIVDDAVATCQHAADAKQIRLIKVADPLPEKIFGDASRLQQVVWNLISNSIKFTPKGGRVQVTLRRVSSHVEIQVSDNGEGIPAHFLPHVFERFRQADASSTRQHGGLGIGLSIVRNLVELHGGEVFANSAGLGQGSTFTVKLPLPPVSVTDEDDSRGSSNTGREWLRGPTLQGLNVLVVDDEHDARELVRRLLEERDASVTSVGSAREALDALKSAKADVMISDIGMPGLDGYDLIRELRARGDNTPAAALTAFARSEDRTRALLAGYQTHVAKPVEAVELVATVASLAGRTRGN